MRGGRLSGDGEDVVQAPHLVPTVPRRDVRRTANLGRSRVPLPGLRPRPRREDGRRNVQDIASPRRSVGTSSAKRRRTPERPRQGIPTRERGDEGRRSVQDIASPRRSVGTSRGSWDSRWLDRAETWWCAAGWVCPCGSLISGKIAISEVKVKRIIAMAVMPCLREDDAPPPAGFTPAGG